MSFGDLNNPLVLDTALASRATRTREIILTITDLRHRRWAANLLLQLNTRGLTHHLVLAATNDTCIALGRLVSHLGCGTSSYLQNRKHSMAVDRGLAAYRIDESHPYHLWWARWACMARMGGKGYRVLSLDSDIVLHASPYDWLHSLSHHALLVGLDADKSGAELARWFPCINVGFVYFTGAADGAAQWLLAETARRFEAVLLGNVVPLPRPRAKLVSQMVLWEQDTFRDVVETSAFGRWPSSHRHVLEHMLGRAEPSLVAARREAATWDWQREQLNFTPRVPPTDAFRIPWLRLHASHRPPRPAESMAGLPHWIFAPYKECPYGNVCDGSWGLRAPPHAISHFQATRLKHLLARLLGWWRYEVELRPLADSAATARKAGGLGGRLGGRARRFPARSSPALPALPTAPTPAQASPAQVSPAQASPAPARVFGHNPQGQEIRLLVLRNHSTVLLGSRRAVRALWAQMAQWVMVALALGRRAVLPYVPCPLPAPPLPPKLAESATLVSTRRASLCSGAEAAEVGWRDERHVSTAWAPSLLAAYEGHRLPPSAGCCVLAPDAAPRCVSRYGIRRRLADELLLTEGELSWWADERRAMPSPPRWERVQAPAPNASAWVDGLRMHAAADALVVDLGGRPLGEALPGARALADSLQPRPFGSGGAEFPYAAECVQSLCQAITAGGGE